MDVTLINCDRQQFLVKLLDSGADSATEKGPQTRGSETTSSHGGPGSGFTPRDRTFFDPSVYRIVLMDQRGAGKSTPAAEIRENTTWLLVSDIETLRQKLGIERWMVFGGSWGSTLALVYAIKHAERVKALILRGIFTVRRKEVIWLYQDGGTYIFPDEFEEFLKPIPEVERFDLMGAYYRRLTGDDKHVQVAAAKAWSRWEMAISRLYLDQDNLSRAEADNWALQFARIECHYFVHGGFMEKDDWILANVDKIRHIPTTIIHGRYDIICPVVTAWDLHKVFPEADFHIVPDAGHSNREPGIQTQLLNACDKYKDI